MNPIETVFESLRQRGQKAFIPFLTACDPSLSATVALARALAHSGASLLEIGFPYSDPIADGPVIQASYTRALARGLHLDDIFACAKQIAESPEFSGPAGPGTRIPLVAMTAYSLVYRRGPKKFLEQARAAGFSGAIVPDLPLEEARELAGLAKGCDFELIQLVTPTTPRERAAEIASLSTGFLYCVSITGITGARDSLPTEIIRELDWLRQRTQIPLCVGFGISKPEHVRALRDHADGVIVGSAIVRHLEGERPLEETLERVATLARELSAALAGA